jgi:hypothetical protein
MGVKDMRECKHMEAILLLMILVFTLWTPVLWIKWLVVGSAALLLVHKFGCKKCHDSKNCAK